MEIRVNDRELLPSYHQIGLQGEYGVETYRFLLPRFYNGVDLALGVPYLLYTHKETQEEGYVLLSKEFTEETLEITWIVGSELTKAHGTISVQLKISGLESALWKSKISRCAIAESLTDTSPQPQVRTRSLLANAGITPLMANPDIEPPITITERKINVPGELRNIATQNDVASETVQIMLPRYFDGHDLSTHDIYLKTIIPGASAEGDSGRDDIYFSNPRVEATEIWLTWELKPPQTSFHGTLRLQLFVVDKATGGKEFKWETDPSGAVSIYESLDASPALPSSPQMMDEFRAEMTALKNQTEQAAAGVVDSEARAKQSAAEALASEQRAQVAAELAEGYAEHPPVILMNGNWGIWDVQNQVYVDSGSPARGPMGPAGPAGSGTGDMLYEQYDPSLDVLGAGGIAEYIKTMLRDGSLLCNEYDDLGLLCDEYDAYMLTADQYDTMGKIFLTQ